VEIHPLFNVFITHKGLFEFNAMLFGSWNAPAVFQHLMYKVIADLYSDGHPPFVFMTF